MFDFGQITICILCGVPPLKAPND